MGSTNYTSVQSALNALNLAAGAQSTTTAGSNIEVIETTNANGSTNYQVKTKDDVTFSKATVGGVVVDGSTNKISGLAAGTLSSSSTEAVNGSQLYALQESPLTITGNSGFCSIPIPSNTPASCWP